MFAKVLLVHAYTSFQIMSSTFIYVTRYTLMQCPELKRATHGRANCATPACMCLAWSGCVVYCAPVLLAY